ncbi:MAG: hypothetical protein EXX96DRAFT_550108 [Benjaminiella poitrasii]|nr:MAG: hypothetical protein EXX96DRAFT_550108 [Benjaminiella poitrasii]
MSASFRQKVLNDLYCVLKDPLKYGDRFLLQITKTPKDGLVPVNLLHDMAKILNPFPLEYIKYCIPLDIEHRFKWNIDISRVGLKENRRYYETDPYGFASDELKDNDEQSLSSQQHNRVLPVIFDDGKFYVDNEYTRFKNDQQHVNPLPEYDLLHISPLGLKNEGNYNISIGDGKVCFNCDATDHAVKDCPRPQDRRKIAQRRQEVNSTTKRFHEVLKLEEKKMHFKPGVLSDDLKEALGMEQPEDEPPYYTRMRLYGYPPGYLTNSIEEKEDEEPCLLKIYYSDHSEEVVKEETSKEIKKTSDKPVELVHYPGLKFINTSRLDRYFEQQNIEQQPETDYFVQQQLWNQYYYEQQLQEHPPGVSQSNAIVNYCYYPSLPQHIEEYPPGTLQPEIISNNPIQNNRETSEVQQTGTLIDAQQEQQQQQQQYNDDDESVDMDISSDEEDM